MDSYWEDDLLSSRHTHNRRSRKSTAKTGNVSHVFGIYRVQCAKADAIAQQQSLDDNLPDQSTTKKGRKKKQYSHSHSPNLNIRSFTTDEDGLVGSLHLPGVLNADVHMAGSRKGLEDILATEYASDEEKSDSQDDAHVASPISDDGSGHIGTEKVMGASQPSDTAETSDIASYEEKEQARFNKFEKNTFRQPKFWLSWKGEVLVAPQHSVRADTESATAEIQSGMGYLVFSGNRYEKFNGTISCDSLGWKDIAISGRKQ
ncbi:uncharacterized protein B0J16DRAFT_349080 [Fusarium flagelliforme]|uniref:Catalase n=1 Tax=Fusarium flagelliforme TaxID=2675880 RepID=A0A395M6U1_9HYPO|nr:uncharacterized protein B0J16DRAFT_349080 [Fusarium flagelliforme]KAH7174726.1 hypothetical protein B0J16DRAFT_349080 [Fusarium flagelliforme]RFN41262.1 catalase [Fusarium flagelliforme]